MTHHQNKTFLDFTDYEAVKEAVQEQINLLGSEKLYQRINNNLSKHKFEAFFAEEQFKLYAWRAEYFFNNFGPLGQRNTSGVLTWHSDGGNLLDVDGNFDEGDIVPYQITKNFDMVMALACSPEQNVNANTSIYFKSDLYLSYNAEDMFNPVVNLNRVDGEEEAAIVDIYEDRGMSFGDVAHMIVATHRTGVFGRGPGSLDSLLMCAVFRDLPEAGKTRIATVRDAPKSPCSLLESSMKAILLHDLPLGDLPKTLQKKAREGLYSLEDSVPTDLTSEGRRLYNFFRDYFIEQSKEEDSQEEDEEHSEDE